MPKPRIRLKLSDIDVRKVSDGEESVADNILVKIKDEATATRESIEKLNDVMTRLADAFAASLVLEKKEMTRQVKKDQREKTEGDIADDVKKKKEKSADIGGAIMRGATNPFGVLSEGLQKMASGIGSLFASLGASGLSLLGSGWQRMYGAPDGGKPKGPDGKRPQRTPTPTNADGPSRQQAKTKFGKIGSAATRMVSAFGRLIPIVGLGWIAFEVGSLLAPFVKDGLENWANEIKKNREAAKAKYDADMAKEKELVNKSITDGKNQIQEATKGYEEALKAGNTELAKKYKESIQSVKDEWKENMKRVKEKHAAEVLRLKADITTANQLGAGRTPAAAGAQAKAVIDSDDLSSNEIFDNEEKIVQSILAFEAYDTYQKEGAQSLDFKNKIQEMLMMEPDYEKLSKGELAGIANQRMEEYLKTTGKKGGKEFMVAVNKASQPSTGEYGPSGMDQFMGKQQKKEGQIRLAKQRKARAVNVRQESIGKTARLNDHKNVHGMGVMEYQSGTAVRVDDFGSRPEGSWFEGMSEGLKEAVTSSINEGISTVSNAWDGVVSWFQSEESKKEEESRLKKENTEYMKKVSEDIGVLNKFFTEGNNITIVKGGDSITVNGGTTLLNNSQQTSYSGSTFPVG